MKHIAFKICCAAVLLFAAAGFCSVELANDDKRGLWADSVEQILRMDENQIDLATALLIISKYWHGDLNVRRVRSEIDDMAGIVVARIAGQKIKSPREKVDLINKYLYDELKFSAVSSADDPLDLLLDSVVARRRGYCLSLSVLYLTIGERVGLPLHGVVAPGHFFVRYDDGQNKFNIETTQRGAIASNEHYIKEFNIPLDLPNTIYMQNLSKKQTLGCFFNNLGNLYFQAGDTEAAGYYQEKAVIINPTLAEARNNLGNVYLRQKQWEDAIEQYRTAMRIKPGDAKTIYNLASAYHNSGQLDTAMEKYNESLALDSNLVDAYRSLAQIYYGSGQTEKAERQLQTALKIKPDDADLYIQIGNLYLDEGKKEQAINKLRYALVLDHKNPAASYWLGNAYLKSNLYHEAVAEFSRAVSLGYNNQAAAHFGLAYAYAELENPDLAAQEYIEAIRLDPNMQAAIENLGNIYLKLKQYRQAIEQFRRVVEKQPQPNAQTYFALGTAYSGLEDHNKAAELFQRAIEIRPDYAEAHNNLAIAMYYLKDYAGALKHAERAAELDFEVSADLIKELRKLANKPQG